MDAAALISTLPLERRLALSYAPAAARAPSLALFALDVRLASVVQQAREPILAQMRLAWWRERLADPDTALPAAEPVLQLAQSWGSERPSLAALVDGWECLLGDAPLPSDRLKGFADGRGAACASLAKVLGSPEQATAAQSAGRQWSLAELALKLSQPVEKASVHGLIESEEWHRAKLSRAMRPLQVLHGLSRRSKGQGELLSGPMAGLSALRLGLFGF